MKNSFRMDRRRFVGLTGALALGGCDQLPESPAFRKTLYSAETLTRTAQRLILSPQSLAPEYSEADLSPSFRANGSTDPDDPNYRAFAQNGFRDWRLKIDGLVERPAELSLAELRQLPSRTQITRHDCVEGWSCIGKWKGVPLGLLLERAGVKPAARYVVFHCADAMDEAGSELYYESIDFTDALHPQTILAYEMNGEALPVPHGAPLRLRLERQLGYKMAKYVMRIELAETMNSFGQGQGGYWEDNGYEWYGGI
jgi:DMSO/TMAO reductase YedYZ molybdopterin-dependent catalytic subunit